MKRAITGAVLAAALVLTPATAGTAVRLELEQLVAQAELVFEGRVVATRALVSPSGRVETEYFVSVHRSYWGQPAGTQVFRMPGGVLPDGSGMLVPGMPTPQAGEDAVFFLSAVGSTGWRMPVGLAQGVLEVVIDADGERALVRPEAALELLDPATGAVAPHAGGATLDYARTVQRIQQAAQARRTQPAEGR